jgi:hypothetical protein
VDIDDGYTFDDLTINEVFNDVGLLKITSPDISGCSLGSANPLSIRLKNYNNTTLNNILVSYRVNGGAIVNENIASIAPGQTLDYVFNQTADLSAYIDYSINAWIRYPSDTYPANDSILNFVVIIVQSLAAIHIFKISNSMMEIFIPGVLSVHGNGVHLQKKLSTKPLVATKPG